MEENKEENVYSDEVVEEKVDGDELDPEEAGFMQGYNEEEEEN